MADHPGAVEPDKHFGVGADGFAVPVDSAGHPVTPSASDATAGVPTSADAHAAFSNIGLHEAAIPTPQIYHTPSTTVAAVVLDKTNLTADPARIRQYGAAMQSDVAPLAEHARGTTVGITVQPGNFAQADALAAQLASTVNAANAGVTSWETGVTQTGQSVVHTADALSGAEQDATTTSKS
ncbi:MAG: hypothetical protein JWN95_3656 [Frankiales bacterium]|nr:hypothetical protein [Frankiales bacterium]